MQSFTYELFADYFQFYLQDEGADGDLGDSWSQKAVDRLLAIAPGAVGIGTVRDTDVPVTVEVLDAAPNQDFVAWDHVVECSMDVPTGRVIVAGCSDYLPDAARIEVVPGHYRVRASYAKLAFVSSDGLDGLDSYRVQMWLGESTEPQTLKQRSS